MRDARATDLARLIELLADDPLGATRETIADTPDARYERAFGLIQADANNELLVAEAAGAVVGLLQLTFIPGLTYTGAWRAQIEGVRVARDHRGSGVGETLVRAAIDCAGERGCRLVQLTSDKSRPDAIRFYEKLGFVSSHEGLKLRLE